MGNAIYHKSSKGRPAYIVKDGERLATFLHQPTYDNGVRMAWALSDQMGVSTPVLNQPATLEHVAARFADAPDLPEGGFPSAHGLIGRCHFTAHNEVHHNPRSLSHRPLGDDEFYTAQNVQL